MGLSNDAISQKRLIFIFDIAYEKCYFDHIIAILNEPARPRPAITQLDELFLYQFKRYILQIWSRFVSCFQNSSIKFSIKSLQMFQSWCVSPKDSFLSIFHTMFRISHEQLILFPRSYCFIWKNVAQPIRISIGLNFTCLLNLTVFHLIFLIIIQAA